MFQGQRYGIQDIQVIEGLTGKTKWVRSWDYTYPDVSFDEYGVSHINATAACVTHQNIIVGGPFVHPKGKGRERRPSESPDPVNLRAYHSDTGQILWEINCTYPPGEPWVADRNHEDNHKVNIIYQISSTSVLVVWGNHYLLWSVVNIATGTVEAVSLTVQHSSAASLYDLSGDGISSRAQIGFDGNGCIFTYAGDVLSEETGGTIVWWRASDFNTYILSRSHYTWYHNPIEAPTLTTRLLPMENDYNVPFVSKLRGDLSPTGLLHQTFWEIELGDYIEDGATVGGSPVSYLYGSQLVNPSTGGGFVWNDLLDIYNYIPNHPEWYSWLDLADDTTFYAAGRVFSQMWMRNPALKGVDAGPTGVGPIPANTTPLDVFFGQWLYLPAGSGGWTLPTSEPDYYHITGVTSHSFYNYELPTPSFVNAYPSTGGITGGRYIGSSGYFVGKLGGNNATQWPTLTELNQFEFPPTGSEIRDRGEHMDFEENKLIAFNVSMNGIIQPLWISRDRTSGTLFTAQRFYGNHSIVSLNPGQPPSGPRNRFSKLAGQKGSAAYEAAYYGYQPSSSEEFREMGYLPELDASPHAINGEPL